MCEWKWKSNKQQQKIALLLTVQERVNGPERDIGRRAHSQSLSCPSSRSQTQCTTRDRRDTGIQELRERQLLKHEAVTMSEKWNNV